MLVRGAFVAAICAALLCGAAAAQQPALERAGGPIVVELYTSQGCDFCDGANRLHGQLAQERDILPLAFPVTYWDYLGWRDTFAQNDFTRRQRAYRRTLHARGLETPQFIIAGAIAVNGARRARMDEAVSSVRAAPAARAPRITVQRNGLSARFDVASAPAPAAPADVWFVSYDPGPVTQLVRDGPTTRLVVLRNLVRSIRNVGAWSGASLTIERTCRRGCAVLVQAPRGGPILAAAATTNDD